MTSANQAGLSSSSDAIGWYVHLPFCRTKCGYCDFYSLPTIPALIDDLLAAIMREIETRNPHRPVEAIFFGGGTPTELPAEALERLLSFVASRTGPVLEWTVEANPTSVTELHLDVLREAGVNRISFGAQSFHPDDLRVLERLHDPVHIGESVRAARAAGFDNLNLDLIYGIPGQSIDRWRDTLRRAIDLQTEHLSCYSLMYEEGTALTRQKREGRLVACDEDLEAAMFELTIQELTATGFEHYEISNFAKPGRACRSNVIYWENREYLGVGPSAVSFLDGVRRKNIADVRRYCECTDMNGDTIVIERERLNDLARAGETAVQMLRLTRGIRTTDFRARTGFHAQSLFAEPIARLAAMGLLEADADGVQLTRRGQLVANRVMQEFLLEEAGLMSKDGSAMASRLVSLPVLHSGDQVFRAS